MGDDIQRKAEKQERKAELSELTQTLLNVQREERKAELHGFMQELLIIQEELKQELRNDVRQAKNSTDKGFEDVCSELWVTPHALVCDDVTDITLVFLGRFPDSGPLKTHAYAFASLVQTHFV